MFGDAMDPTPLTLPPSMRIGNPDDEGVIIYLGIDLIAEEAFRSSDLDSSHRDLQERATPPLARRCTCLSKEESIVLAVVTLTAGGIIACLSLLIADVI
jgi:hypothetical protein